MTRYEYRMLSGLDLEDLNKLGNEGWELVTIQRDYKTERHWYYFKRPKS